MNPTTDQLTAYALGEGTPAERAAIEAYLAIHPDAQAEVAAIREAAALISDSLLDEPAPGLDQVRKDALATLGQPTPRTRRVQFPTWLGVIATGAVAAGIAVAVLPEAEKQGRSTAGGDKGQASAARMEPIAQSAPAAFSQTQPVTAKPMAAQAAQAPAIVGFAGEIGGVPQEAVAPKNVLAAQSISELETETDGIAMFSAPIGREEAKDVDSTSLGRGTHAPAKPDLEKSTFRRDRNVVPSPASPSSPPIEPPADTRLDGEGYHALPSNGWHRVTTAADDANRLSTFGADVDTASYANVRRFLRSGQLPPPEAVRAEELINAFSYHYTPPRERSTPFAVHADTAACPWDGGHRLVRIGLKGYELDAASRPPANLVFLVDVSGSMNQPNKLPLVQRSLTLLTQQLRADDRVAIVTYAGGAGLRLDSTTGEDKAAIIAGIDQLSAGGSTNGAGGITLAYEVAKRSFIRGGANRVVLCTDGDFNVGVSSRDDLERLITEQAKSGVFLTALGFGMGNFQDTTLQVLANKGNGQYAYIDGEAEARKHLVDGSTGTLVTIAKDLKLQVEFNPATVAAWRLIGYEKRALAHRDFLDDTKDAGELGAGHTVTALYEIEPAGSLPPLRYAVEGISDTVAAKPAKPARGELLTVSLRWKLPDGLASTGMAVPVTDDGQAGDADTRFAAAVAEFACALRREPGTWELGRVLRAAQELSLIHI
jgi:secreted protein with Ig-like and vWFA domain/anti-sigma factor RsiW